MALSGTFYNEINGGPDCRFMFYTDGSCSVLPSGGGRFGIQGFTEWDGLAVAPALSPANQGRIYFDPGTEQFLASVNGGAYLPLAGSGGGNVTHGAPLTANQLIIGAGGAGIAALGSLGTTNSLLQGNAAGPPSWVQNASINAITLTGALVPVGGAGTGVIYYDVASTNEILISENNGAFVPIGTVRTSVAGTTNAIAKFTGASTLGNSSITDDGTNITTSENIGINVSPPVTNLDIAFNGAASVQVTAYRASANAGNFTLNHARGTIGAPSALLANDRGGTVFFQGYNANGSFLETGELAFLQTDAVSGSAHGKFQVAVNSTPTIVISGLTNTISAQEKGAVAIGAGNAPVASHTLNVSDSTTSQTVTPKAIVGSQAGGCDTTAGGVSAYGLFITSTGTRTAGANNQTNIGGYFSASGAQVNISAQFDAGNVYINSGLLGFGSLTAPDVGITRNAAGILEVNSGTAGTFRDLQIRNLKMSGKITSYNNAAPTDGQLLIGDTAGGTFDAATLTAGTNITITNAGGSITINSTASGGGNPAGSGSEIQARLNGTTFQAVTNSTSNVTSGCIALLPSDSGTSNVINALSITHNSSATPDTNGFGVGIRFGLKDSTTSDKDAGQIATIWNLPTDGGQYSRMSFSILPQAPVGIFREVLRLHATHWTQNTTVDFLSVEAINNGSTGPGMYVYPSVDGVGALVFTSASGLGGTVIMAIDTQNARVGVNVIAPIDDFAVHNTIALNGTNGVVSRYFNQVTGGSGVPWIASGGYARSTAQTAAVASVAAYTVATQDGSFLITANVNVTAYTAGTFTVTVTYTDEGNTSRTTTLNFSNTAGVIGTAIAAAGVFQAVPITIRARQSQAITIATTGTFTSLTYNVEGAIIRFD